MIGNLIKIELAYINTSHPDFIGGRCVLFLTSHCREDETSGPHSLYYSPYCFCFLPPLLLVVRLRSSWIASRTVGVGVAAVAALPLCPVPMPGPMYVQVVNRVCSMVHCMRARAHMQQCTLRLTSGLLLLARTRTVPKSPVAADSWDFSGRTRAPRLRERRWSSSPR